MLLRRFHLCAAVFAIAVVALSLVQKPLSAGVFKRHCHNDACAVQDCEFFGYHPTCWQPWPEGWPGCADRLCLPQMPAAESPPSSQPPDIELIPPPKVESSRRPRRRPDAAIQETSLNRERSFPTASKP